MGNEQTEQTLRLALSQTAYAVQAVFEVNICIAPNHWTGEIITRKSTYMLEVTKSKTADNVVSLVDEAVPLSATAGMDVSELSCT